MIFEGDLKKISVVKKKYKRQKLLKAFKKYRFENFLGLYFAADTLKRYFLKAFEQLLAFLTFFLIKENL
jgi:hypothetical protein